MLILTWTRLAKDSQKNARFARCWLVYENPDYTKDRFRRSGLIATSCVTLMPLALTSEVLSVSILTNQAVMCPTFHRAVVVDLILVAAEDLILEAAVVEVVAVSRTVVDAVDVTFHYDTSDWRAGHS